MTDPIDPVETLARERIEALAYRLWSIHPRDIPDPVGMPDGFKGGKRAWFYANQISALVADAVKVEREACAKVADASKDEPPTWSKTHDVGWDNASLSIAAAIRALPLPPQPPLADDVAGEAARLRAIADIHAKMDGSPLTIDACRAAADLIERLVARAVKAEAEVARLREALEEIARQRLSNQMDKDEADAADWEAGYDMCVGVARIALTPKGDDHE